MPDHLDRYLRAFRSLKVNRTGGPPSPHKPCMLLAVLGLAAAGHLKRNEIRFDPALLERYVKFFAVVRSEWQIVCHTIRLLHCVHSDKTCLNSCPFRAIGLPLNKVLA